MTKERQALIDIFQKWLDTNPREQIIAAQCATIAEEYAEQLHISDVRQRLINHIETRINYFYGGENMKSLREISTDRDMVKELEYLRKIINDDNF